MWRSSLSQGGRERPLEEVMGRKVGGWEDPGFREQRCKGPAFSTCLEYLKDRKKPSTSGAQRG